MAMQAKVQKCGGDLVVLIPKAYAEHLQLTAGDEVRVTVAAGRLIIEAMPRMTLAELLADVTPENAHAETDWGASVGGEAEWWA